MCTVEGLQLTLILGVAIPAAFIVIIIIVVLIVCCRRSSRRKFANRVMRVVSKRRITTLESLAICYFSIRFLMLQILWVGINLTN